MSETIPCRKCGRPLYWATEEEKWMHRFDKESPGYCWADEWERTPKKHWTSRMRMYHDEARNMILFWFLGGMLLCIFLAITIRAILNKLCGC